MQVHSSKVCYNMYSTKKETQSKGLLVSNIFLLTHIISGANRKICLENSALSVKLKRSNDVIKKKK